MGKERKLLDSQSQKHDHEYKKGFCMGLW